MPSAETPTRKLLIIAYNFPPQLSGVRRTVKFIKYLAPLGWDISVLTVKPVRSERFDNSPLEEIKGRCKVFRSGSFDPYRLHYLISDFGFGISDLNHRDASDVSESSAKGHINNHSQDDQSSKSEIRNPKSQIHQSQRASSPARGLMNFLRHWIFTVDDRVGWLPFAMMKALRLVRHERPDWIMTTSLPNTSHLVGLALKMLHPRLKWVADFRDGWTLSGHYYAPPTPLHRLVNERLERAVARRCDLLVTVSPPLTEFFKAMPGCDSGKCHTITNGYDPEDFKVPRHSSGASSTESPSDSNTINSEHFTLIYTGSFFGSRSPESLLLGLAQFLEINPGARDQFRAEFYSQWDAAWLARARELSLADVVRVHDLIPYRECIAKQAGASALLLLVPAEPHEPIMMTQKVFEYLAARRPILCLAPEGVAARTLLGETGGAAFAHPDDPTAITRALGELWAAWKSDDFKKYSPRGVEQFARPALVAKLNELMTPSLRG